MNEDRRTFLKLAGSIPVLSMFGWKVPAAEAQVAIEESTGWLDDGVEETSSYSAPSGGG